MTPETSDYQWECFKERGRTIFGDPIMPRAESNGAKEIGMEN